MTRFRARPLGYARFSAGGPAPITRLLSLLLFALLAGCASNAALDAARAQLASGNDEAGLRLYEDALRQEPDNRSLRSQYFRQRELVFARWLGEADAYRVQGRLAEASELYARVQRLDPDNARARQGLSELDSAERQAIWLKEAEAAIAQGQWELAENRLDAILERNRAHERARLLRARVQQRKPAPSAPPSAIKSPFEKPISLEFRDVPIRQVFEVIARSANINFVFDKDVRPDIKVTLFVRNTSIDEVVRLILTTNQLDRKLLSENSVLVYPNTPAKQKDYQELVVKSFFLANADPKQALALVKALVKTRDAFIDEKLNLLIVKDTAEAVRLTEQVIAALDQAEPEVVLEVEVLEIARTRLRELGIRFPDTLSYGVLGAGGAAGPASIDINDTAQLLTVPNPSLILNLKNERGSSNLLANPRIRVKNREKAKVHIGDKVPVFTTTSTANVGVSASVAYLDVGLKLEVEPQVSVDDDVSIKVNLEVSSIIKEIPGPAGSLAYQVGTRLATTVLRLRNGETQILAGLISDEERNTGNRLPGLGDLPLVGRLFGSERDASNKTEIVLLITPRIVRSLPRAEIAGPSLPSGTDTAVGVLPLRMQPQARISLSTQAPTGPRTAGLPEPATPPANGQLQGSAAADARISGEWLLQASLTAPTAMGSAQAVAVYDPAQLEFMPAEGSSLAQPGRALVNFAGGGTEARADLRFKVVAKAPGSTAVQLLVGNAQDSAGAQFPVNAPAPITLRIVP